MFIDWKTQLTKDVVSKLFYRVKAIPVKIQAGGYKPDNSKIYKEKQRNWNS